MYPIENLYRYPVKGLSAEPMDSVKLTTGHAFPLDRKFAITNGSWQFDASTYTPRPKTDFLTLMQHEALAEYSATYDEALNQLRLAVADTVEMFALNNLSERQRLSALLAARLGSRVEGTPQLVEAEGAIFTDVSVVSASMMNAVSLINLSSLDSLSAAIGAELHPLRFRANIYFRSATPWEELSWVGQDIRLGGVLARVLLKTRRCAATNVNPLTALRDQAIPQTLIKKFRHGDLGVYAEIIEGGELKAGDYLSLAQ